VSRCAAVVFAIVVAACGQASKADKAGSATTAGAPVEPAAGSNGGTNEPFAAPAPHASASPGCELMPFAATTPVPEASGAAWITVEPAGRRALLVVGDSGNHGAYGLVDPETGATFETGALPLGDGASDDTEGVAARGDKIYGLTSSGWVRVWQRKAGRFELLEGPYPLGPVDLPDAKNNNRAPKGDGMVCNGNVVNCGRNYEGLCLAARPRSPACIGFAASKADGHLYCLSDDAGRLVVHRDRAIAITRSGALADCAFADDDTLWAGSNMFDLAHVYKVTGWDDPAHATVDKVGILAVGFPEGIAVRGDVVYRLSDTGGAPSMMAKFRCPK
jgi:outer membrane protein assembly factor BamB